MIRTKTISAVLGAILLLSFLCHISAPAIAQRRKTGDDRADAELEFVEARYGAGDRWRDVKPQLEKVKHRYFAQIDVFNDQMGGDPAPQVAKELVVRCRLLKTEVTYRYPEGSTALILAPSDPSVVQLWTDRQLGRLMVLEAQHGRGEQWQDWTLDVRSAAKEPVLSANSALGLTRRTSVFGKGRLV